MVARLKLKEIDGRAPPGVNRCEPQQPLRQKAARKGRVAASASVPCGMPTSNASPPPVGVGNTLKLRGTPKAPRYQGGAREASLARVNNPGYGHKAWRWYNGLSASKPPGHRWRPCAPRGLRGRFRDYMGVGGLRCRSHASGCCSLLPKI